MTIQNWSLSDGRAVVVCDSLASTGEDYRPVGMVSKVWIVPHLPVMIAAKNWMWPAMTLHLTLAVGMRITRWSEIVTAAPAILRDTAATQTEGEANTADCRVVLFGYDDDAGEIAGCRFDGATGFAAEPFGQGEMFMPGIPDMPSEDWARAVAQKAHDDGLSDDDRDNIGGPVIRAELSLIAGHPAILVRHLGALPE